MQTFILKLIVLVSIVSGLFGAGWYAGADSKEDQYREQIAKLEKQAAETSAKVITKYVDRVQYIHTQGETITNEVPIYVPIDSADFPLGFRLLHDAAVRGEVPNPAGITDAKPVPARTATRTVVRNYTTCRKTEQQLISLQEWIRGVSK